MIDLILAVLIFLIGICIGLAIRDVIFIRKREKKIHELNECLAGARKAHEVAERRLEDVSSKNPAQIAYICDEQACADGCINSYCHHTCDIRHARNFEYLGEGRYFEKLEEPDEKTDN
jgi:hypothetical protein